MTVFPLESGNTPVTSERPTCLACASGILLEEDISISRRNYSKFHAMMVYPLN